MPIGLQAAKSEVATSRVLDAALELFSTQGYGATSMRQIAEACDQSVGNLYHHFGSKEAIFQRLIDDYWEHLLDPDNELQRVFDAAEFPDDLEDLATAIERSVEDHRPYIMLIFIDVIEFSGTHIRAFYETMAARFQKTYSESFEIRKKKGLLGEVDPLVAVMVATRWMFYFYTVEKCFGVPMHFGMDTSQAIDEFIKIVRFGVLPRGGSAPDPESPSD